MVSICFYACTNEINVLENTPTLRCKLWCVPREFIFYYNCQSTSDIDSQVWQYDCRCSLANSGRVELTMGKLNCTMFAWLSINNFVYSLFTDQTTPLCVMPSTATPANNSLSGLTTIHSTTIPSTNTSHNTFTVSPTITYNSTVLPTTTSLISSTSNNNTALPTATSLIEKLIHFTSAQVSISSYSTMALTSTPNTNTPSSSAPGPISGQWHLSYLLIPVILLCSITVVLVIVIVCYCRFTITSSNSKLVESGIKVQDAPEVKPKVKKVKILVVYSRKTPSEDIELVLTKFVQPLTIYGVDAMFYDPSHARGGIPEWVEYSVAESSKVFLVCNEQFKAEWEDSKPGSLEGNIIHVVKQNFLAHMVSSSEYSTKFSLLFLRTSKCYETCMPSKYLYNLRNFVVKSNDESVIKQVVRYIMKVSEYYVQSPDD